MIEEPSPEELIRYRQTLFRREEEEKRALAVRTRTAWEVARSCAHVLRSRYGAARVVLFGSLVRPAGFHARSDVDLAAWGLAPEETFSAIGEMLELGGDLEVNLVDAALCRPSLLERIEKEGVEL